MEDLDAMLASADIAVAEMPRSALFLAGQVFKTYSRRVGPRTSVLPDFFIGAHAAALGAPLITRDTGRYRSYFPTIQLIAPE
jgi:predicted nucleic acid-binding protein